MNSPPAGFDRERLHELAASVLDGRATKEDQVELTSLLSENATARDEYIALLDLHAILATEITGLSMTEPDCKSVAKREEPIASPPVPTQDNWKHHNWRRRSLYVAGLLALGACILVSLLPFTFNSSKPKPDFDFVTVAHVSDADWVANENKLGARLGAETISLKSGLVRLEYDNGVEVTLQGPIDLELLGPFSANLKSGVLTANIPPNLEAFTVRTPTAEVIDQGTSFGIELREDGVSNVSVFDGEVEVAIHDSPGRSLLSEGESIRIEANQDYEFVEFNPQPFEKLWPIASGIAGSTSSIRFIPPWPRHIRFVENDDTIFIAMESRGHTLSETLPVNISQPGSCSTIEDLSPIDLPPGIRVRSYVLHYSPIQVLGPLRAPRVSGTITFDRPILGVIVQHSELLHSSRRFSNRGMGEKNPRRELKLTNDLDGDRISLSPDRKTLTLDLVAPGQSSDLVRVIVEDRRRNRRSRVRPRGNFVNQQPNPF